MTTTLERPPTPLPPVSVARTSRFAQWWGQWRVALRLARRDAWRGKGRSILVLLIVGLPVMAVSAVILWGYQTIAANQPRAFALAQLDGEADAVISPQAGSPAEQSVFGDLVNTGEGPAATERAIRSALPEGARMVAVPRPSGQLVLEAGEWGLPAGFLLSDMSDPLLRGYWHDVQGSFPQASGQVLLDAATARRLHVGIGDEISAGGTGDRRDVRTRLVVVGLGDPNQYLFSSGVAWPGDFPVAADPGATPGVAPLYLVDSPTPLTWDVVRAINGAGAFVTSRAVVEEPPAFCDPTRICLDDGPAPGEEPELTPQQSPDAGREAALGGVVVVLVVLQIALLAGPAFAVQLRRRQRELGLVGASGGDAKVLRRTVLASGVVLGVVASVGGAVLAWLAIAVATHNDTLLRLFAYPGRPPLPPFPPELLGVIAVGIVASVAAALVPAVVAGRGDVIETLRGRRPLPALRRSLPLVGLGTGLLGLLVMVYGVIQLDSVVLGVGVVLGELGVVLLMPWLIVQTGRLGSRLPLAGRLAIRDSGRHRMRTAAAACAVAAAAAAAVGVSAAYGATATYSTSNDVATLPDVSTVSLMGERYAPDGNMTVVPVRDAAAEAQRAILAADPAARTALLVDVIAAGTSSAGNGFVVCGPPPGAALDQSAVPCQGRQPRTFIGIGSSIVEVEPDDLSLILGPSAPLDEARAALEAGGAVVLQPHGVADGMVVLTSGTYDLKTGESLEPKSVDVPAIEVLQGALPASVLVSAETLARPEVAAVMEAAPSGMLLAQPSQADSAERPTFVEQVNLEMLRGDVYAGMSEPLTQVDETLIVLLAGVGITALLALLAGLMVTALALADGKADHATLQAVGAGPRVRRRIAASTAGYVAGLGCLVGALSGLLGSYVLLPLLTDGRGFGATNTWSVPWPMLGLIVVAVPLITATAAWLTTRSSVPLTRRTDT